MIYYSPREKYGNPGIFCMHKCPTRHRFIYNTLDHRWIYFVRTPWKFQELKNWSDGASIKLISDFNFISEVEKAAWETEFQLDIVREDEAYCSNDHAVEEQQLTVQKLLFKWLIRCVVESLDQQWILLCYLSNVREREAQGQCPESDLHSIHGTHSMTYCACWETKWNVTPAPNDVQCSSISSF